MYNKSVYRILLMCLLFCGFGAKECLLPRRFHNLAQLPRSHASEDEAGLTSGAAQQLVQVGPGKLHFLGSIAIPLQEKDNSKGNIFGI